MSLASKTGLIWNILVFVHACSYQFMLHVRMLCLCHVRRGHMSVATDCMLCDWPCAWVFVCMLRHKEAPNILQLQKKLEVLPVQILSIESFLFVAWPGIPLQKPCVLWVHCWLLIVFCVSCLWLPEKYVTGKKLFTHRYLIRSIHLNFLTYIWCLAIFSVELLRESEHWTFKFMYLSRHFKCMEK